MVGENKAAVAKDRRDFLKKASAAAVTAPAVALLLSRGAKAIVQPLSAQRAASTEGPPSIG